MDLCNVIHPSRLNKEIIQNNRITELLLQLCACIKCQLLNTFGTIRHAVIHSLSGTNRTI